MCGEHASVTSAMSGSEGSSPHVRGALLVDTSAVPSVGIIPACAGSTPRRARRTPSRWDHPRMCGEHRPNPLPRLPQAGIIPACAGSTGVCSSPPPRPRDHPRMCGEHPGEVLFGDYVEGSSPHVRGAPHVVVVHETPDGIIPACAGSTARHALTRTSGRDHPRMCGEHSMARSNPQFAQGSSPHVRGALASRWCDPPL